MIDDNNEDVNAEIVPRRRDAMLSSSTQIKICGVRDWATIQKILELGNTHDLYVRYFGLVRVEASPRYLPFAEAAELFNRFCDTGFLQFIEPVFLYQNHPQGQLVDELLNGLNLDTPTVQLHGDEDEAYIESLPESFDVIKAIPFDPQEIARWKGHPRVTALLIDSPAQPGQASGGTGRAFDWNALADLDPAGLPPIMLAGGLTPDNVGDAVRTVKPWAVDVSSGVESSRGVKDPAMITAFCEAVRAANKNFV